MTENVSKLIDKEVFDQSGVQSYLLGQMLRELADRVLDKIAQNGECICRYIEPKTLDFGDSICQVEYRSSVDIQKLVRCKDCEHRRPVCSYNPNDDFSVYVRCNLNCEIHDRYFFCADGKEKADATLAQGSNPVSSR